MMMMKLRFLWPLLAVVWLSSCQKETPEQPLFQEITADKSGITFQNTLVEKDSLNILDYLYFYNGGGVATGDVNNDGLPDVFFTSNNGKNKLYLNKGKLKFEDVSSKAGIEGQADWNTGATMADVNGDGWLDIYVSAVSKYRNLDGHNELFINNGDGTFTERAKEFGVDFQGFSTQAAFFDYDHDGDLDMYLLNHAVHTVSSYDKVSARALRNNEAGDVLYRNEGGKRFEDVSGSAGIYGAAMGYGLGISIGDFNNDGWDDIFVGNDFHEDDYLYLNNQNGTFTERSKQYFDHLSRFSMGNDAADINNDGLLDIITVDMYPDSEEVEKASAGEDPLDVFMYKLQFGFYKQFSRNCLHLNQGDRFSDIALFSGVAATDWSWSPLLADFDNDGYRDLFISNGIKHRPNNLDYIKYITDTTMNQFMTEEAMKNFMGPVAQSARKVHDKKAIDYMPDGKVANYIFRGNANLKFTDKSAAWGFSAPSYSNGAAYADLDNDGDLDLITNELETTAKVWENKQTNRSYIQVSFNGNDKNTKGLGAKVYIRENGRLHMGQNYATRGFLSASDTRLHFGLDSVKTIDTLAVVWPSGKVQIAVQVAVNQHLTLKETNAKNQLADLRFIHPPHPLFEAIAVGGDSLIHRENPFYDFTREPLIPFKLSTEGPKIAVGDIDKDGLDDIYLPAAKFHKGQLFKQQPDGSMKHWPQPAIEADSLAEDISALFFDADNDGDVDLYVVSGGNEYYEDMVEQFDRLYLNDGSGNFTKNVKALPPMFANKSQVSTADFDNDGDLDLVVGGRVVPYQYGVTPTSYLLQNNGKGIFTDVTAKLAPELQQIGMVTDMAWIDADKDNDLDLLVVGDWMPPTLFINNKGELKITSTAFPKQPLHGFWHTISLGDFDGDGDIDAALGNLGTNNKFIHDPNPILKMWVGDLDNNGGTDQIIGYNRGKSFYPIATKDDLGKRLPAIVNKKYTTYKAFAGQTIEQIFGDYLAKTTQLQVNQFASVWLENTGEGQFNVHELPALAQFSKIFSILPFDVDNDKDLDLLVGGNFYQISTYQGSYDAFNGVVLLNDGKGNFTGLPPYLSGFFTPGETRQIVALRTLKKPIIAVSRNNASVLFFQPTF